MSDVYDDNDSMAERGRMAPLTGIGFVDEARCLGPGCTEPAAPGSSFCCDYCAQEYEAERALDDDADAYHDRVSDPND